MGNANSAALGALDEGPPPSEQGLSIRAARLYVFEATTNQWNVARALVEVDFADDAAEGDAPDWHVEVRALKPSCTQLLRATTRCGAAPNRHALSASTRCALRRRMRRCASLSRV